MQIYIYLGYKQPAVGLLVKPGFIPDSLQLSYVRWLVVGNAHMVHSSLLFQNEKRNSTEKYFILRKSNCIVF